MKDEIVSFTLNTKNFFPAFLVIEEHAHYINMCAIEIFTQVFDRQNLKNFPKSRADDKKISFYF